MKKGSGRGQIVPRDDELMLDLYYIRVASIPQVEEMYFKTYAAARKRLYELSWMGLIENKIYCVEGKLNLWMLTKRGFRRQAEDVGNEDERYRDWPTARNIRHYIDTNDVYTLVSGPLEEALGKQPAWHYRDEARASHYWKIGSQEGLHRPDAEIELANRLYFIERQTERSRKPQSYFDERMQDYQGYFRYAQAERGIAGCEVVWVCDTQRDLDYALRAGEKYGIDTTANRLVGACKYLVREAKERTKVSTQ